MKAIHFGAGNIGRGFIGEVLHKNDFELCFADTNPELVAQLNQDQGYSVEIIDENDTTEFIDQVTALNSFTEAEKVIKVIIEADLVTTSVGANNLVRIAPTLTAGLRQRFEQQRSINILANENMINASELLKQAVYALLSEEEQALFDQYAYFVNTAIDRQSLGKIVAGRAVALVEPYHEWVINQSQLDPATPFELRQVVLVEDMQPYIERKLFLVNAAHAATAYLGALQGYKKIQETHQDKEIMSLVKQFLAENVEYFVKVYQLSRADLSTFTEKTLKRQGNPKLLDGIARVGGSPIRKLGPDDRLVAPVTKLQEQGLPYEVGVKVIAAGYHYRNKQDPEAEEIKVKIETNGLAATIREISQVNQEILAEIVAAYETGV